MRNLSIYQKSLALLLASTITLCGCSSKEKEEEQQVKPLDESACLHLTLNFGNDCVTFKECEGYSIDFQSHDRMSKIIYAVSLNNEVIIGGYSNNYQLYEINHELADDLVNNQSLQKVKK